MGFTALFYLLAGIAFTSGALRLSESEFVPHVFWSCALILAGASSAVGWVSSSYKTTCLALTLCAAVSFGFGLNFLANLIAGDTSFLLGAVVWSYIGYTHFMISRLPDPYPIDLLHQETARLRRQLGETHNVQ